MTGARLPQELFEAIIDELQMDKKTLATCRVVCTAWLPSASRHLFAVVQVDLTRSYYGFTKFVKSHPSIIPLIHHLVVFGDLDIGDYLLPPIFQNLLNHLDDLTGLKLLELSDIFPDTPRFSTFSNIVSLSIRDVSFDIFVPEFVGFICAFPFLQTLRTEGRVLYWEYDDEYSLPLPPGSLQDLELDVDVMIGFLNWLLSCKKIPAIRAFWHKIVPQTEAIGRTFLLTMDNTLERISFEHYDGDAPFDLSCNSQLRFVHFDLEKRGGPDWHAEWVTETLSQIGSNLLEEVSISLIWEGDDEPELLDWSRLDMILSQPQFSWLRKIRVFYRGRLQMVEIEERLPGCHTRGILYFTDNRRWDYRGFRRI